MAVQHSILLICCLYWSWQRENWSSAVRYNNITWFFAFGSCFGSSQIFLKKFDFQVRVFRFFCTYISERLFRTFLWKEDGRHVWYRKAYRIGKKTNAWIPPPPGAAHSLPSVRSVCPVLFLSLVGAMGIMQSRPINATGMYGTILLHEGAGGYVLVAVISFTVAVVITALCIKFRKKGQKSQDAENHV